MMTKTRSRSTAGIIASVILLSGCSDKTSSSEADIPDIPTWASAEYSSDGFTKYDLRNFSFTVSDDLVPASPVSTENGNPKKIEFKSDLITHMSVEGYESLNMDTAYYGESLYEDIMKWEGVSDVSYELMDLDGFQAVALNYKRDPGDGLTGYSDYVAICEGMKFEIFAYYPAENADRAVPVINDIIRSIVYACDYRLPTEEQHFENDVYSMDFGSEWVMNVGYKSEIKLEDDGLEFSHMFTFAKAASEAEVACMLIVEGGAMGGVSEAEKADSIYSALSGKDSYFNELERSQSELLGHTAEVVSYEMGSGDSVRKITDSYIGLDGNLIRIQTYCPSGESYDEASEKLNELIRAIELK